LLELLEVLVLYLIFNILLLGKRSLKLPNELFIIFNFISRLLFGRISLWREVLAIFIIVASFSIEAV
jgi:hypothetical protein